MLCNSIGGLWLKTLEFTASVENKTINKSVKQQNRLHDCTHPPTLLPTYIPLKSESASSQLFMMSEPVSPSLYYHNTFIILDVD